MVAALNTVEVNGRVGYAAFVDKPVEFCPAFQTGKYLMRAIPVP